MTGKIRPVLHIVELRLVRSLETGPQVLDEVFNEISHQEFQLVKGYVDTLIGRRIRKETGALEKRKPPVKEAEP